MHNIIFYSKLILILINLIGFGLFIDLYFRFKEKRFMYFIFGWFSWLIADIIPALAVVYGNGEISETEIFLSGIFIIFGFIALLLGISYYFLDLRFGYSISILLIYPAFYVILSLLLDSETTGKILLGIVFFVMLGLFLIGMIRTKFLYRKIGNSTFWYYLNFLVFILMLGINLILTTQGERYGLYESTNVNLIIVRYLLTILWTVLLLVLFIHIEYSLSSEELKESELRYRTLFENSPIAIFISDFAGKILAFNKKLLELSGYSPTELANLNANNLYDNIENRDEILDELKTKGYIEDRLLSVRDKYGATRYGLVNINLIEMEGERVLLTLAKDITEEQETKLLRKELEKYRDDFIYMTSHELRTPLHVCIGFTDFLLNRAENLSQKEYSRIYTFIYQNLLRLERLALDVGSISHLERGIFELNLEEIQICTLIKEYFISYSNLLGKSLSTSLCQDDTILIKGDKERLYQVFDNIMDNAIKHTFEDKRNIIVRTKCVEGFIEISIVDNGVGIISENLDKIFEKFVSIPTETTISGTGIGLYLTRETLSAHQGTIQAKSDGKDKGATFIIRLPLLSKSNKSIDC